MTVEFHWLEIPRVVEGTVSGSVSIEALKAGVEMLLALLNAAEDDQKIHLLVNNSLQRMPGGLIEFRDAVYPALNHPRLGWTVIYGLENHYVKALIETLLMVQHRSFYFAATRADALAFLRSADPSLPELPLN